MVSDPRYADWRAALSEVQGIYLITDASKGKQYVGKADGAERILGRWRSYAQDGHGGNVALRDLAFVSTADGRIRTNHARHFVFSILRVFGPRLTHGGRRGRVALQERAHDPRVRPEPELDLPLYSPGRRRKDALGIAAAVDVFGCHGRASSLTMSDASAGAFIRVPRRRYVRRQLRNRTCWRTTYIQKVNSASPTTIPKTPDPALQAPEATIRAGPARNTTDTTPKRKRVGVDQHNRASTCSATSWSAAATGRSASIAARTLRIASRSAGPGGRLTRAG
jgi:hypothetical protein